MDDGNERCATPTSLIPEHASTCGDGEDADDGTGSSTRDSSSVGEDDDSSSEEEDVDGGGSSVGTELALELARWEVEWVPEPEAGGRSRRRGEGGGSSPRGPLAAGSSPSTTPSWATPSRPASATSTKPYSTSRKNVSFI
jgi:hypothetical protein